MERNRFTRPKRYMVFGRRIVSEITPYNERQSIHGGILVDQFYDNPAKLSATIEMNLKASDGLMVFDIVHIINKGLWKEVENGMRAGGALE